MRGSRSVSQLDHPSILGSPRGGPGGRQTNAGQDRGGTCRVGGQRGCRLARSLPRAADLALSPLDRAVLRAVPTRYGNDELAEHGAPASVVACWNVKADAYCLRGSAAMKSAPSARDGLRIPTCIPCRAVGPQAVPWRDVGRPGTGKGRCTGQPNSTEVFGLSSGVVTVRDPWGMPVGCGIRRVGA